MYIDGSLWFMMLLYLSYRLCGIISVHIFLTHLSRQLACRLLSQPRDLPSCRCSANPIRICVPSFRKSGSGLEADFCWFHTQQTCLALWKVLLCVQFVSVLHAFRNSSMSTQLSAFSCTDSNLGGTSRKSKAWTMRAVEKITDCQKHPKTAFPPQTLIPILASVNFFAKILIFFWSNWKSFRSSSLSSFSSASFHSFILRQSSNLWRFNIFAATANKTWKKRLCSEAILLTFHQLFKNCNLRISTAPFPLTSTVLKSSFHRLSRFGSGSGPWMNNGASGSLGQPMRFHRDASLDIIHHTGYHIPSDVNNMPIIRNSKSITFITYVNSLTMLPCDRQISTQIPTALNLKRSSIQTIETTSLSRASHHDTSWRGRTCRIHPGAIGEHSTSPITSQPHNLTLASQGSITVCRVWQRSATTHPAWMVHISSEASGLCGARNTALPQKYRKLWTLHYCMWFLPLQPPDIFLNLMKFVWIIMNRKQSSIEKSSCLKSEGISVLAADRCNGSLAHLEGVAQVSRTVRDAFTGSSPVVSPA